MIGKEDEVLTVPQAAERLGVDNRVVRRAIETGQLPAMRLGGKQNKHYRVLASDLMRMFQPQKEEGSE